MKRQLLLLLFMVTLQASMATVRYASPSGHDREGLSAATPGDLRAMIGLLKPGDRLLLLDGQYDLTEKIFIPQSGRPDSLITICAAPGAHPVFDFRHQPNGEGNNGIQLKGSYFHLKGFTVRYAGYKGIWLEYAHHCLLELLDVYGCCNAGIQIRKGGYNTVLNCDAHDNFDYQDKGGNADGFADKQGGGAFPGNIYIGCRAWHNSDDGWDSYQRTTADGVPTLYVNCIAYENGLEYFDLSNHPRVLGVDSALACFKGKDLKRFPNGGNPNGFKVGGKGTKHDVVLTGCIAVGQRLKGFDQNHDAGSIRLVNCTAYHNFINYGFGNDEACQLEIYNSISLEPTDGQHLLTPPNGSTTQGGNSWNEGHAVGTTDFESLDVERYILAPRQADGSLPPSPLHRLCEKR